MTDYPEDVLAEMQTGPPPTCTATEHTNDREITLEEGMQTTCQCGAFLIGMLDGQIYTEAFGAAEIKRQRVIDFERERLGTWAPREVQCDRRVAYSGERCPESAKYALIGGPAYREGRDPNSGDIAKAHVCDRCLPSVIDDITSHGGAIVVSRVKLR